MKTPKSFSSLSEQHAELDRLFTNHQRALVEKDLDSAVALLTTFAGGLDRHIEFEEHRLLPVYADKGAETARGTLQIFQAEHRKLRDDVEKLMHLTEGLRRTGDITGSIVSLLGKEMAFKQLFHHHAAREQNVLFPRLDERTTEAERDTWLSAPHELGVEGTGV
jgi:iron-sulfur cluster repair protein YtfE (RIC family)